MDSIEETSQFYNDQRIEHVKASHLLHSILVSHNNLRWNPQGEIVYNGIAIVIPNTSIVKLVKYCLSEHNFDIPIPSGLITLQGLKSI